MGDICLIIELPSYITALLSAARADLMLETQFSSCMRIRSATPVREKKPSARVPRTNAKNHVYVSARLGGTVHDTPREELANQEEQKGAGMLEGTCLALFLPLRRSPSRGTATLPLSRFRR